VIWDDQQGERGWSHHEPQHQPLTDTIKVEVSLSKELLAHLAIQPGQRHRL
jgi:hypothetical protein